MARQHSCRVMCKICSDITPCNGVTAKPNSHRVWITMEKSGWNVRLWLDLKCANCVCGNGLIPNHEHWWLKILMTVLHFFYNQKIFLYQCYRKPSLEKKNLRPQDRIVCKNWYEIELETSDLVFYCKKYLQKCPAWSSPGCKMCLITYNILG